MAFQLPFLRSEFNLTFPWWIPHSLQDDLRAWLIEHGRMHVGDQYLWSIITGLFVSGDYLVGSALMAFSVVFPLIKLSLCGLLLIGQTRLRPRDRLRLATLMVTTGKWAMADVFVVATVIVLFKADGFQFSLHAGPGIYCYATAALLTSGAATLAKTPASWHQAADS